MNLQLRISLNRDRKEAETLGTDRIATTSHLKNKAHRSIYTASTQTRFAAKTSRKKHYFSRNLVKNRNVTIVQVSDKSIP